MAKRSVLAAFQLLGQCPVGRFITADEGQPGADLAGDGDHEGDVDHPPEGHAASRCELRGDEDGCEKGDEIEDSIGVDREFSEVKEDRVHDVLTLYGHPGIPAMSATRTPAMRREPLGG